MALNGAVSAYYGRSGITIPKPIRSMKIVIKMITNGVVTNFSLLAAAVGSFDGCWSIVLSKLKA